MTYGGYHSKYWTYLYGVQQGEFLKVGSAWEPEERIKQSGHGGEHVFTTQPMRDGRAVERITHEMMRLDGLCVRNEWFRCTTTKAADEAAEAKRHPTQTGDR